MTGEPDALTCALDLQQAGRLDAAEAAYRAILADDPDEPDALNLLGLVLQNRGALDEAIEVLSRALEVDPDFPEALTNLARAQRAAGDLWGAVQSARRATELDPDLAEAFILLSRIQMDLGDDTGVEAAQRAAALLPESIDAQTNLGLTFSLAKNWPAATQAYRAALALQPDRIDLLLMVGGTLIEQEETGEALQSYRRAEVLAPDNPRVRTGLAVALQRNQDPVGSAEACRRALELEPERADLLRLLGDNLTAMGDFEAAAVCFRQSLALEPGAIVVQRGLSKIDQMDDDASEIARLLAVVHDDTQPGPDRVAAGFSVGTLLDKTGEYDKAFACFAIANRLYKADLEERGLAFDAAGFRRTVDSMVARFRRETFAALRGAGDPSELPVFIVGMPRSGTTLVEQIAASHKQVFGAGEQKAIGSILQVLEAGETNRDPLAWDLTTISREATRHVARLREWGGEAERVTDKLPDNILLLGVIAILFPQARIVLCRRDLRDVCLSCYVQQFADGMLWTYDLADLAARARAVDGLMTHWLKVLPLRILEIKYETLVADLEGESRRLIEFLGLPWDPDCLAFHRTERVVLTASNWQVRQPLYASSVGRWQHYRNHLRPLLDGLPLPPGEVGAR